MREPITLNLEATGVSPEALDLVTGGYIGATGIYSLIIDTIDTVSGAPLYPRIATLDLPWWRVLERRRRIATRERMIRDWEKAYAAWVAEGRPDREVLVRRYLPQARIEVQGG